MEATSYERFRPFLLVATDRSEITTQYFNHYYLTHKMVANMDNVRTFMQNLEVTTEDRTFDVANKETFFTILRPSMI